MAVWQVQFGTGDQGAGVIYDGGVTAAAGISYLDGRTYNSTVISVIYSNGGVQRISISAGGLGNNQAVKSAGGIIRYYVNCYGVGGAVSTPGVSCLEGGADGTADAPT